MPSGTADRRLAGRNVTLLCLSCTTGRTSTAQYCSQVEQAPVPYFSGKRNPHYRYGTGLTLKLTVFLKILLSLLWCHDGSLMVHHREKDGTMCRRNSAVRSPWRLDKLPGSAHGQIPQSVTRTRPPHHLGTTSCFRPSCPQLTSAC